jgi:hypothetical protein
MTGGIYTDAVERRPPGTRGGLDKIVTMSLSLGSRAA